MNELAGQSESSDEQYQSERDDMLDATNEDSVPSIKKKQPKREAPAMTKKDVGLTLTAGLRNRLREAETKIRPEQDDKKDQHDYAVLDVDKSKAFLDYQVANMELQMQAVNNKQEKKYLSQVKDFVERVSARYYAEKPFVANEMQQEIIDLKKKLLLAQHDLLDCDNKRLQSERKVKEVRNVYENIVKDKYFYL